jgi:hypothetical protein
VKSRVVVRDSGAPPLGGAEQQYCRKCVNCSSWRSKPTGVSLASVAFMESKLESLSLKRAERRLLREYLDLPGLSLTLAQAARLVNVDAQTCEVALNNLLKSQCLAHGEAETYVRGICDGGLEAWKRLVRNRLAVIRQASSPSPVNAARLEAERIQTVEHGSPEPVLPSHSSREPL